MLTQGIYEELKKNGNELYNLGINAYIPSLVFHPNL